MSNIHVLGEFNNMQNQERGQRQYQQQQQN